MRVLYLSSSPHVDTKLPAGVSVLHPENPTLWSSDRRQAKSTKVKSDRFEPLS